MEFDDLVDFYLDDIRTGDIHDDFWAIIDSNIERFEESGDADRLQNHYSENPNDYLEPWIESWWIHNSLDERLLEDIDSETPLEELTGRETSQILEIFFVTDYLKSGYGTNVKPVAERQIEKFNIDNSDIRDFVTPERESFRTEYHREMNDLFSNNGIDASHGKAKILKNRYCRGSEKLFQLRSDQFDGTNQIEDNKRDISSEKEKLRDKYGKIVDTVDDMLYIDNYAEDLFEYNMRGLTDFFIRDQIAQQEGLSIDDRIGMLRSQEIEGSSRDYIQEHYDRMQTLVENLDVEIRGFEKWRTK